MLMGRTSDVSASSASR